MDYKEYMLAIVCFMQGNKEGDIRGSAKEGERDTSS